MIQRRGRWCFKPCACLQGSSIQAMTPGYFFQDFEYWGANQPLGVPFLPVLLISSPPFPVLSFPPSRTPTLPCSNVPFPSLRISIARIQRTLWQTKRCSHYVGPSWSTDSWGGLKTGEVFVAAKISLCNTIRTDLVVFNWPKCTEIHRFQC